VPSPQTSDKVTVSAKSLEDVLAALQAIADNIAASTAVGAGSNSDGGGSTTPTERVPTVVQSRAILDYLAVNQLLARVGIAGRIVSASRECQVIRLRGIPTAVDGVPVTVTQALVTPGGGGASQLAQIEDDPDDPDDQIRRVVVDQIDVRQPIVRIELQDANGVPVALGPRLAPVADPDDCDDIVDVNRRRRSR
jgi:hypothetical protein